MIDKNIEEKKQGILKTSEEIEDRPATISAILTTDVQLGCQQVIYLSPLLIAVHASSLKNKVTREFLTTA